MSSLEQYHEGLLKNYLHEFLYVRRNFLVDLGFQPIKGETLQITIYVDNRKLFVEKKVIN